MNARIIRFAAGLLVLAAQGAAPAKSWPLLQREDIPFTANPVNAGSALTLTWEKLVPPMTPLENPYDTMSVDEQDGLYALDNLNTFSPGPVSDDLASEYESAKQSVETSRQKLASQGVDLEAVYKHYTEWAKEVERRGRLTIAGLNGKHVAIAGYLLPLDFNDAGAKEFLLVPYVGACIHVPPPPPNQVIYVKTAQPYQVGAMFDGVMVTGVMKVGRVKKDLSLMDGAGDVEAGYVLETESIEPYQYEESGQ